jgi:hypothetical protein
MKKVLLNRIQGGISIEHMGLAGNAIIKALSLDLEKGLSVINDMFCEIINHNEDSGETQYKLTLTYTLTN